MSGSEHARPVWLVTFSSDYVGADYHVLAVFSTEQRAKEWAERFARPGYDIEEMPFDPSYDDEAPV